MLWYLLLASEDLYTWEHRIGAYQGPCRACGRTAWQFVYRLYQTKGSTISPATPQSMPVSEWYQVRCEACFFGTATQHPSYWVQQLGVPFQHENWPPTQVTPAYANIR